MNTAINEGIKAYEAMDYKKALEIFQQDSCAEASFYLGKMYYDGKGVYPSLAQAAKLFLIAANDGHAEAQYLYAKKCCIAWKERKKWFQKAARQGHALAQWEIEKEKILYKWHCLANYLDSEDITNMDIKTIHDKAENGDGVSQYELGIRFYRGEGVAQDKTEAAKWILKAATNADCHGKVSEARVVMGKLLYDGEGVDKDEEEAEKYFHLTEKDGYLSEFSIPEIQYLIGLNLMMGSFFMRRNIMNPDYVYAAKWLGLAAANNYLDAQIVLGKMFYDGLGVEKDEVVAQEWFQSASKKYNYNPKLKVGCFCCVALKDYADAAKWFRMAASEGSGAGYFWLGVLHLNGKGVQADLDEAEKCFNLALNQASPEEKLYIAGLLSRVCHDGKIYVENTTGDYGSPFEAGNGSILWNEDESYKWQEMSAKEGYLRAQWLLSFSPWINFTGDESFKWKKKAAEQGHAISQYELGLSYYHGRNIELNYEEALRWFQKAAEQEKAPGRYYSQCNYHIGLMYFTGRGVDKDYAIAADWLKRAMGDDDPSYDDAKLIYQLAIWGREGKIAEGSEAEEWFHKYERKREGESGRITINAKHKIGRIYLNDLDDAAEAAKWFNKAAKKGFADAQHDLGKLYYQGKGVNRDYSEAFNWFQRAAEQNNQSSLAMMAIMCFLGRGSEKDKAKAERLIKKDVASIPNIIVSCMRDGDGYKEEFNFLYELSICLGDEKNEPEFISELQSYEKIAEENSNADAQYSIGKIYSEGIAISQNYEKARKWFRMAAEQGHLNAQYELGRQYDLDCYGNKDENEAIYWLQKAAEKEHGNAINALQEMYHEYENTNTLKGPTLRRIMMADTHEIVSQFYISKEPDIEKIILVSL